MKKILTQQNAGKYLGKKIDCSKRRFQAYPLAVIQWTSGLYAIRDRNGVEMRVPDENDTFNAIYFDIISN